MDREQLIALVQLATAAANEAGDEWLKNAKPKFMVVSIFGGEPEPMLDNCGNAHLQFKDKRTKWYKDFLKAGLIRGTDNGVIEIHHKYKPRQEHGLAIACIKAAKKVLEDAGVHGLRVWDYID